MAESAYRERQNAQSGYREPQNAAIAPTAQTAQRPPRATLIPRGRAARKEAGEDYALRKVPAHFKRTPLGFAMPLTGLSWSMFFFAVGGTLALSFGFPSIMLALGVTT